MSSAAGAGALPSQLDQRILVLDGGWGTMLQSTGPGAADYRGKRLGGHPRDVTGDPDLLNLTRPDVVREMHRQYLAAGADITTTNTFTATSIGQADYGLQPLVREILALAEGGVDLLLVETIFDTLNAKPAIAAARDVAPQLPLWISVTIVDMSGRTPSGQTVEAFWRSVERGQAGTTPPACSSWSKT
jgi:5-methyltetrahydrofolate--homocysteine methyltransferase